MKPWIEVIGGNKWYYGSEENDLKLTVSLLAKALSHINRFGGHTSEPYSVAQHSVWVADHLWREHLDPKLAMAGLLHDAPEMLIGDITTPFKWYLNGEAMDRIEAEETRAYKAILKAFELSLDLTADQETAVKKADRIAVITEKREFLCPTVKWGPEHLGGQVADRDTILARRHKEAAKDFVIAFNFFKSEMNVSSKNA